MDSFTCACCRETFEKGRSDEMADAERDELFGNQDCELVCEDCFKLIMGRMEPETDISKYLAPEEGKK